MSESVCSRLIQPAVSLMSERAAIEQKIDQCRRLLATVFDSVTTVRLRDLLTELEAELARLE